MARALSQILTELNSVYKPQKDLYNKQLTGLDPQLEAENKGLEATKTDSFNSITQGANRRGLLFSGIPLAEQAQYTGQQFLPAVANLKAKYAQQKFNLQDALLKLDQEQRRDAYGIYDQEIQRDEAAAARRAAAAARSGGGGGASFGGGSIGGGGGGDDDGGFGLQQRDDRGFNFVDSYGNNISAAQYAAATGQDFRGLLQYMANKGDKGAAKALGFVGDDFGYDPTKIGGNASLYNSLIWGTKQRQAPTSVRLSGTGGGLSTGRGGAGGGGW